MNVPRPSSRIDDRDRAFHLTIALTLFFFGLIVLSLVGEWLGWWNDFGEVLLGIGTAGGAVGAVATVVMGSTRRQVNSVARLTRDNYGILRAMDDKLDDLDKLDELDRLSKLDMLGSMDSKLDALAPMQDALDGAHFALERQTGVLDRQLALLTQIRDRL